ncbi:MAG: hypothetical protein WDN04_14960 [Rhodospirillales bacterium]
MHVFSVLELRPADKSAAAIQAAIDNAGKKRGEVEADMAAAEQRRGMLLVAGSAEDNEANEAIITTAATTLAQLDAFMAALQQPLADATKAERIAALLAKYDSFGAVAAVDAFVKAYGNYAKHARAIAEICALEEDAVKKQLAARNIADQLAELGATFDTRPSPWHAAIGPVIGSLGRSVRLPGAFGAPKIPLSHRTETTTQMVEKFDWDNPGPTDFNGRPLKKILVEEKTERSVPVALRADKPFWWAPD